MQGKRYKQLFCTWNQIDINTYPWSSCSGSKIQFQGPLCLKIPLVSSGWTGCEKQKKNLLPKEGHWHTFILWFLWLGILKIRPKPWKSTSSDSTGENHSLLHSTAAGGPRQHKTWQKDKDKTRIKVKFCTGKEEKKWEKEKVFMDTSWCRLVHWGHRLCFFPI